MPTRHNPTRRAARAALQEQYHVEQTRRERAAKSRDDGTALDATAEPFDLPAVELREDPRVPDDTVTVLSLYGGTLRSLSQVKNIDRFTNLASLCVHGCRLTRMDVMPALRACRGSLTELNLSSNRIAKLEGFPHMPALKVLDLTNNALESLGGIDEGAPVLISLVVARNKLKTLHALGVPRADTQPWALENLDVRDNFLRTFADVAAGLGAVTSLKTLRVTGDDTGSSAQSKSKSQPNPIVKNKAFRQAVASIAPWIDELDSSPLSRTGVDLAEGSAVLDEQGAFEKSAEEQIAEEKLRESMERGSKRERQKRRTKEPEKIDDDTDTYSESSEVFEKVSRVSRDTKPAQPAQTPKIDLALARYKTKREKEKAVEKNKTVEQKEDPAVIDHEMRLRRIERNLVTAAANANRASVESTGGSIDVNDSTDSLQRLKQQVEQMERAKRAASASPTGREETPQQPENVSKKNSNKTRRIDKVVPPSGPPKKDESKKTDDSTSDDKPPWQKPDLKPTRGPAPTTPERRAKEAPSSWADMTEQDAGDDETNENIDSSTLSTSAVSTLQRALEESKRASAAAAEKHELEKKSLSEDHAKFVAAMNVALLEANQVRDAILLLATEEGVDTSGEHSANDLAGLFRDALREKDLNDDAREAAAAATAELVEVREDFNSSFNSMRTQHSQELAQKEDAVAMALVARDAAVADATAALENAEASTAKLAAVENEFRAALEEAASNEERLTAEVDEFTRVAREALRGKSEAERLAEELAEVCEQQRSALEEMARDSRRADRAEADCAAARADCGEMTTRLRNAEKRAAASKAAETAALQAFEAVKDEKVAAHSALAEIKGVREQLQLALDNGRVKDAMLQSQAELVISLKAEAQRARESSAGAVKAAAEQERAAEQRARRAEDDVRREGGAVERLERALEEARVEKESCESENAELRRAIAERDATLGYVGAEVESVKTMFGTREDELRTERDELALLVQERDEFEANVRNDANKDKEEAARTMAEATEQLALAAAKLEQADVESSKARETVRRVEGEMRSLLQEVAQQRRKTRELGSALQSMYA